jgi:hypothetical protein
MLTQNVGIDGASNPKRMDPKKHDTLSPDWTETQANFPTAISSTTSH